LSPVPKAERLAVSARLNTDRTADVPQAIALRDGDEVLDRGKRLVEVVEESLAFLILREARNPSVCASMVSHSTSSR